MEFSQTYGLHRMIEHNIINYWKVNLANSNDSNLIDDEDELFCGIVSRRKPFSLISNRGHCQRSSPSRISYTPWAGFEPAQNLSSGFVEYGRLKNVGIISKILCVQCSWVKKLYDESFHEWKIISLSFCSVFFIKFLFFHQMIAIQKLWKMFFLFHLKSSFHSRDIQIFVIFFLPYQTFQIQKDKWKWNKL